MSGRGLLLLVERVFPDRLEVSVDHQALVRSDLTMLVAHAAGERTEKEFRNLVESAGFTVMRFIPIGMTFNIIEAIPLR